MLMNDFKHWKVKKIVKDKEELKEIEDFFQENIKPLKDIYITLLSNSTYPNLTWLDFGKYIQQIGIIDENLSLSQVDMLFIATNIEETKMAENNDRALCRYEFWEILVRLAKAKGSVKAKLVDSLRHLVSNIMLTKSFTYPWQ